MQRPSTGSFDPNRLFDALLRTLNLEGDEALAQILGLSPDLLFGIRRGRVTPGAALLIRINEKCGISVRELRQMMGDRRAQYRLDDNRPVWEETAGRAQALPGRESRLRNEAGLPNTVQWT